MPPGAEGLPPSLEDRGLGVEDEAVEVEDDGGDGDRRPGTAPPAQRVLSKKAIVRSQLPSAASRWYTSGRSSLKKACFVPG